MNFPVRFEGRNVFVAGGSSGINLGIAKAFAQAGAQVAIVSRNAERVAAAEASSSSGLTTPSTLTAWR